jgi:GNAT superfamily N-acetyltransferase
VSSFGTALTLVRMKRFDVLRYELTRRIRSEVAYVGGALDLESFDLPRLGANFSLRPIREADHHYFTEFSDSELDVIGVLQRINAARRLQSHMRTCYVVVRGDGRPCHMEYLVRASDFAGVEEVFPGRFPQLRDSDALLDYPYTPEECRGQGIALFAMAALAGTAKADGARRLIMYAPSDNPQMLRLCEWAGFVPFIERTESFRYFRRRMVFRELPPGTPYPREATAGQAHGGM